ncbi:Autophagy-related protein 13 [Smittium mucronatum]|uniref:Autophagy-related protein 13 n=1 Tax=Smittium mucronatum TaxID=133383 RepID=A0A1R0H2Z7_9FUNG|nr:Autophagy-related protein 13 [Smittium mucronatum]
MIPFRNSISDDLDPESPKNSVNSPNRFSRIPSNLVIYDSNFNLPEKYDSHQLLSPEDTDSSTNPPITHIDVFNDAFPHRFPFQSFENSRSIDSYSSNGPENIIPSINSRLSGDQQPPIIPSFNRISTVSSRSSVSSRTPTSSTQIEQIVQNLFTKISHIIIQSRVDDSLFLENVSSSTNISNSTTSSNSLLSSKDSSLRKKSFKKSNKWLNLETIDSKLISYQLNYWILSIPLSSPPPPLYISLCLDIDSSPDDQIYIQDSVGKKFLLKFRKKKNFQASGDNLNGPDSQRIILENWKIHLTHPIPFPSPELPSFYKKSIISCRTLFSLIQLLPASVFANQLKTDPSQHFSLSYCISSDPSPIDSSSNNYYFDSKSRLPVLDYSLQTLITPLGSIDISVEYLSQCRFKIERKTSNSLPKVDMFEVDDAFFTPTLSSHSNRSNQQSSHPSDRIRNYSGNSYSLTSNTFNRDNLQFHSAQRTSLDSNFEHHKNDPDVLKFGRRFSVSNERTSQYNESFLSKGSPFKSRDHLENIRENSIFASKSRIPNKDSNSHNKHHSLSNDRFSPFSSSSLNNNNPRNDSSPNHINIFRNFSNSKRSPATSQTSSVNKCNSLIVSPFKQPSSNFRNSCNSPPIGSSQKNLIDPVAVGSFDGFRSKNFARSSLDMPPPRSNSRRGLGLIQDREKLSSSLGNSILDKRIFSPQTVSKPRPLSTHCPFKDPQKTEPSIKTGISFERKLGSSTFNSINSEPKLVSSFQKRRDNRWSLGNNSFRNDSGSPSFESSSNNHYSSSLFGNSITSKSSHTKAPSTSINSSDRALSTYKGLQISNNPQGYFANTSEVLKTSNSDENDITNFIEMIDNKFSSPAFRKLGSESASSQAALLETFSKIDKEIIPVKNKLKNQHHTSNLSILLKESGFDHFQSQSPKTFSADSNVQKSGYGSIPDNHNPVNTEVNSIAQPPSSLSKGSIMNVMKNESHRNSDLAKDFNMYSNPPSIHNSEPGFNNKNELLSKPSKFLQIDGFNQPPLKYETPRRLKPYTNRLDNFSSLSNSGISHSQEGYCKNPSFSTNTNSGVGVFRNQSDSDDESKHSSLDDIESIPEIFGNDNCQSDQNFTKFKDNEKPTIDSNFKTYLGGIGASHSAKKGSLEFIDPYKKGNQDYYSLPRPNIISRGSDFSTAGSLKNVGAGDAVLTSQLDTGEDIDGINEGVIGNDGNAENLENSFTNIDFSELDDAENENMLIFNMSQASLNRRKAKKGFRKLF